MNYARVLGLQESHSKAKIEKSKVRIPAGVGRRPYLSALGRSVQHTRSTELELRERCGLQVKIGDRLVFNMR